MAVPPVLRGITRPGVVLPVRRDQDGRTGPTPAQARGPRWRRTGRGLYVPGDVDASRPEQRIVEAAGVLPDGAAVTGWAALRWCGAVWFDGLAPHGGEQLPVDLAIGINDVRPRAGIRLSEERLSPPDLTCHDGLPVTTPVRSLAFEMRYAPDEREAAVAFAMAAYADLVSIDEITAYVDLLGTWTGVPQARRALALLDENTWSPWEARMCHVWILDAGFPPPLRNCPVFDLAGNHLGTPDLLDVESGTAGEYDGAVHLQGAQRSRDVDREARFRGVGLEYFTMLAGDHGDRRRLVARMHAARARARWERPEERRWTVEPPPWWVPTRTVEQRRRLTSGQRARWLRWRREVA